MDLRLENCSKKFGGLLAVKDVSLVAQGGKITGLIGPNGAGKTTLVQMITGYCKLTSGRVYLDGHDVTTASPHAIARLGVGRTFQTVRLYPEMTVTENVAIGILTADHDDLAKRGSPSRNGLSASTSRRPWSSLVSRRQAGRVALDLLEQFELGDKASQVAVTLSYGDQRRVEVVRALARRPSVMLLDEPVAGMTDGEAAALGRIFQGLAKSGIAVVLIEHNTRLVSSICETLVVLNEGRVMAEGRPAEVLKSADVVAAYMGRSEEDEARA